jgi:AcrR family transcriptional regulator
MAKDRRLRKTETAIQNGLIEIANVMEPNKISVNDVIDASDINKSTFYLHYASLVYVSYAIEDRLVSELLDAFHNAGEDEEASVKAVIEYISLNKKAFITVLGFTSSHFYKKLSSAFVSYFVSILSSDFEKEASNYRAAALFGGCYGILQSWLYGPGRADKQKLGDAILEFVKANR